MNYYHFIGRDILKWRQNKQNSDQFRQFTRASQRVSRFHCECPRVLTQAMRALASVWIDNGKTRLMTFFLRVLTVSTRANVK